MVLEPDILERIRGDFAAHTGRNIIHGSDSPENGRIETSFYFQGAELL